MTRQATPMTTEELILSAADAAEKARTILDTLWGADRRVRAADCDELAKQAQRLNAAALALQSRAKQN